MAHQPVKLKRFLGRFSTQDKHNRLFNEKENRVIDFIPSVCHFDKDSLLTRNGDIFQIIKVKGFEHNDDLFLLENLRTKVREALNRHVNSEELFVYVHTIRERSDISPKGDFPDKFTEELNQVWTRKNNWDKQLVNTLYITILRRRKRLTYFDKNLLFRAALKGSVQKYLKQSAEQLSAICSAIINDLTRFSPQKLTIVQKVDGYYSEPASFINYLVNMVEEPVKVEDINISQQLSHSRMSYRFNSISIRGDNFERMAAIYTIKEMHEIKTSVFDQLLQMGSQFIITEAFHLCEYNKATAAYERNAEKLISFGKENMLTLSGLDEIMAKNPDLPSDALTHCKQYMIVNVFSDEVGFFERKLKVVSKIFHEIGLSMIREDFNMASVFWSQIPGNMRYFKRGQFLPRTRIANFSSIHHRAMGSYIGSKWGPPVTIFRALDGNPYYFNFHSGSNGNTFFIGSQGAGRTTICRFFLSQAMKLEPRVIYIDTGGNAKDFTTSLKGTFKALESKSACPIKVNAFDLRYFSNQKELFAKWLMNLIFVNEKQIEFYGELINLIVDKIFEKKGLNTYENLQKMIEASEDELLISTFRSNFSQEYYEMLFNKDDFKVLTGSNRVFTLDISILNNRPSLLRAYMGLLVQGIRDNLTGERTIVVFDNGDSIADNSFVLPIFDQILADFTAKDALLMLTLSYESETAKHFGKVINSFGHQIFCSYKYLDRKYQKFYQLSDYEYNQIKSYDISKRFFIMKNSKEVIIGNVNLAKLDNLLDILL